MCGGSRGPCLGFRLVARPASLASLPLAAADPLLPGLDCPRRSARAVPRHRQSGRTSGRSHSITARSPVRRRSESERPSRRSRSIPAVSSCINHDRCAQHRFSFPVEHAAENDHPRRRRIRVRVIRLHGDWRLPPGRVALGLIAHRQGASQIDASSLRRQPCRGVAAFQVDAARRRRR